MVLNNSNSVRANNKNKMEISVFKSPPLLFYVKILKPENENVMKRH